MANDPFSFLFRRPSRPEVPATGGNKTAPAQNQAQAPAAATPAAPAAAAPAPAPAKTPSSDSFQVAAAAPAAGKTSNPSLQPPLVNSGHHVGGGNFLKDF